MDAHFPDAVAAEPLVARISVCHSIHSSQYCHPASQIAQTVEPALKRIRSRLRQVVFDCDAHLRF
jgi:hypothetical protein